MKTSDNQQVSSTSRRAFSRQLSAFSSATLLSRILGYARDALVAAYFGGGLVTDAFYAAFKIPNLLRRFLGEGALTAAFIPVFTDVLNNKGKDEAKRFFHSLLSTLLLVLLIIVTVGVIFAPQVASVVAWGFARDPQKLALTIDLVRLTFPFLLVISYAALVSAVLNSCGRFFIPAIAPAGLSIGEIAFIIFFASKMDSPIHGLAISAVIGVTIHLFWQLPALYREGFSLGWMRPFQHPDVKRVFLLMGPTIIGLCADQINSFVDQVCASFLKDGSITALYNSNRVMQMPLALFGIAVASVSLPALSRSASQNNTHEFKDTLNFSLRIANYILIPSFVGLSVLGYPIVQALFQHGRFTAEQSWLTFTALVPCAFGLPAYSATKILASAFYARKNTRTPVKVALMSMIINGILNIALMFRMGAAGLALATSLAAWVQAIVLFYLLRKEIGLLGGRSLLSSFLWGCTLGLVMGGACYISAFWLLVSLPVALRVFISIGVGVGIYFSLSRLFQIPEYKFFMDTLMRRKQTS